CRDYTPVGIKHSTTDAANETVQLVSPAATEDSECYVLTAYSGKPPNSTPIPSHYLHVFHSTVHYYITTTDTASETVQLVSPAATEDSEYYVLTAYSGKPPNSIPIPSQYLHVFHSIVHHYITTTEAANETVQVLSPAATEDSESYVMTAYNSKPPNSTPITSHHLHVFNSKRAIY
ncbi:hypothetical protein J6590_033677, partial [Homalodisca vitripennis]